MTWVDSDFKIQEPVIEAQPQHSFARFFLRHRHEATLPLTTTMASECSPSGGPQMNTDISGIGVRVSFYLQTLFLSEWPGA